MSSKAVVRSICIAFFVFFLAAATFTGCGKNTEENDLEKGQAAYQKGDFKTAAEFFRSAAEQGNAEAQYSFAVCLERGMGIEPDKKQSFEWLRKAAEQDHTKAQYLLGHYYRIGLGVEQNPEEARKWIQKSIDKLRILAGQGDSDAQVFLADYVKNNADAKAQDSDPDSPAIPDDAEGQYKLALRYAQGEAGKIHLAKSFDLLRKAAEQDHTKAQCLLGIYYETGLAGEPDSEEAKKWFEKSIDDLQKLAGQGDIEAQSCLAVCYENGFGIEKDDKLALEWLRKAADQGDASSQLTLGIKYLDDENAEDAVVWLRKAAEQGNPFAQISLGNLYEAGMGSIKPDKGEAAKWFRKAAESNDTLFQKAALDALKRIEAEQKTN